MNDKSISYGKALYSRFLAIWGYRFSESMPDDSFVSIWIGEWGSIIEPMNPEVIKKAINHCRLNLDWPPVISEFLRICEQFDDRLPDLECAFRMAVSRDFSVPEVKRAFERLDSWKFRMEPEKTSRKMFKAAWDAVLHEKRNRQLTDSTDRKGISHDGDNGLEDWRSTADKRRRDARKEIEGNVLFGEGVAGGLAGRIGKIERAH